MFRVKRVSYNLARELHNPAVVNVLKHWKTTSDDPLHCPDYAEFDLLLWGGGSKPEGYTWREDRLDDRCGELYHQCLQHLFRCLRKNFLLAMATVFLSQFRSLDVMVLRNLRDSTVETREPFNAKWGREWGCVWNLPSSSQSFGCSVTDDCN